jgi:hypothetical protein
MDLSGKQAKPGLLKYAHTLTVAGVNCPKPSLPNQQPCFGLLTITLPAGTINHDTLNPYAPHPPNRPRSLLPYLLLGDALMLTLQQFCKQTPGGWLTPPRARVLARQGRIGYWDLERRVFVPAVTKVGPRAWIITCDSPVIKPLDKDICLSLRSLNRATTNRG